MSGNLLKLQISKYRELLLLGEYKGSKVYQVIKRGAIKDNFWESYFIVVKNNKRKRIFSYKKRMELTKFFTTQITYVALGLVDSVDVIDYLGILNGYHLWEAWKEDSLDKLSSIFISYNYFRYIVIEDKTIISEIKATLLMQQKH